MANAKNITIQNTKLMVELFAKTQLYYIIWERIHNAILSAKNEKLK